MQNNKVYEPEDKMVDLITDNANVLQSLGSFGISLGFGDKTVRQVCETEKVDTTTFLAVVNLAVNNHHQMVDLEHISIPTLLKYLRTSHEFFLEFQLPKIRRELEVALDTKDSVAQLILRFYDNYARSVRTHMKYEEKSVFPYIEAIINKHTQTTTNINTFSQRHAENDRKLFELKNIIIKYLPTDDLHNNHLTSALYDIFNNEQWLHQHALVEDYILIPAIRREEEKLGREKVSFNISTMIGQKADNQQLSKREKDIIACIVKGMTSQEIADTLFISTNTVTTHRRNIARKLQIHSPAGLTIYAIVNNIVDIDSVKL